MGLRVASLAAVGAGNFTVQFKFSHCILSSCLSFSVLKWGWELLCRAVNEKQKKSVKNVSRHTCVSFSLGHQFLVHKMTSHIRRHARSTLWVCGLVLCFILQQVTRFTQESEFWSFLSLVMCLGNRQWWAWPFSVATQSSREQPMRGALRCWARVSSGQVYYNSLNSEYVQITMGLWGWDLSAAVLLLRILSVPKFPNKYSIITLLNWASHHLVIKY